MILLSFSLKSIRISLFYRFLSSTHLFEVERIDFIAWFTSTVRASNVGFY